MKFLKILIVTFLIISCSKPKVELICGDHVCVNKAEADQFFQKNLTLEVKIIDNKIKEQINLVELNMKNNESGKKEVKVFSKETTSKNLKVLSNKEINTIKKDIKKRAKEKKIAKKKIIQNRKIKKDIKKEKITNKANLKDVNKKKIGDIDVCTILEKCNIEEISKYLLKIGKNKNFPDITKRQ